MAIIYMLCGKVGSGKSTYAKTLKERHQAMILSCDDLMLSLFEEELGDQHQRILRKSSAYLYHLAEELVSIGVNVVLDFGYWSRKERTEVRRHFSSKGITTELHYINTPDIQIQQQLHRRNQDIANRQSTVYHIDDEMRQYFDSKFDEPTEDEISARITYIDEQ
ncbi:AAA family ATPase [Paenibacillus macquariensis]|uniref:Predicted kinase n=1 Tax=Paenibacillus macquariensis TaxID=948756 RepID=A0ABY1K7P2_9BACL|nr:ATP-binding protein [Paenibacillus macquariensis]MEC0091113.1 ATP-binding protein [Paenibacillus macquariensis]OAB33703.1 hypothetical protein PMSM_13835 [Paenibacillus macquariensis subsp. macquariensis]SIR37653.1 Predicted kinase [Paenibacillus macquariensis]